MNNIPDHPDIRAAELTGYPAEYMSHKVIGRCLYCAEEITDHDTYVKSFDGIFCGMDCCHEYYEIDEICY